MVCLPSNTMESEHMYAYYAGSTSRLFERSLCCYLPGTQSCQRFSTWLSSLCCWVTSVIVQVLPVFFSEWWCEATCCCSCYGLFLVWVIGWWRSSGINCIEWKFFLPVMMFSVSTVCRIRDHKTVKTWLFRISLPWVPGCTLVPWPYLSASMCSGNMAI